MEIWIRRRHPFGVGEPRSWARALEASKESSVAHRRRQAPQPRHEIQEARPVRGRRQPTELREIDSDTMKLPLDRHLLAVMHGFPQSFAACT
jgi:hypothetical protein